MAFTATAGQKHLGPERGRGSPSPLGYSSHGDLVPHPQREFHVAQRSAMAQQPAERPQPDHFVLNGDTKPSTHDFLSLYDKGSQQAGNGSSPGLASSLTTHDFLQPLERTGAYRDATAPRDKHARAEATPAAVPNYTAIPVPYGVPAIRMVGDPEALRSRGYPAAIREDQGAPVRAVEVAVDPDAAHPRDSLAYWPNVRFKYGMPSDMTFPAAVRSAIEKGHQPIPALSKQWTPAALGVVDAPKRPARPPSEEEDDDDDDSSERPKAHSKEPASYKGDAALRVDAKNGDMRGGTPRSKHSATEQRRRSKINDRFQKLRDLVPHSDQKRDKASFLLEVIEYIQVLKEKVRKYESVEQGRHQERLKSMVWDLCKRGSGDETSKINALVVSSGVDVKPVPDVGADAQQAAPASEVHSTAPQGSSRPACSLHSCVSSLDGEKEHATALTAQPLAVGVPLQQAIPLPYALPILSSDDGRATLASESPENGYARAPTPDTQFEMRPRLSPARQLPQADPQPCPDAVTHEPDPAPPGDGSATSLSPTPRIQGGSINVSTVYSQGLLETLTRALQSSGVDLSQANISVQIELGKNAAVAAADTSTKVATTPESSAQSHQSQGRTREAEPEPEPEPARKRPKLETRT